MAPSLAEEGVKPGPTSDTRFLPEPHRPLSYKTLGQELLDLHQTHIKGLISEKEYEIAKFSILRKLKE